MRHNISLFDPHEWDARPHSPSDSLLRGCLVGGAAWLAWIVITFIISIPLNFSDPGPLFFMALFPYSPLVLLSGVIYFLGEVTHRNFGLTEVQAEAITAYNDLEIDDRKSLPAFDHEVVKTIPEVRLREFIRRMYAIAKKRQEHNANLALQAPIVIMLDESLQNLESIHEVNGNRSRYR